tara:strand:+ start:1324 stop:2982 length:1659 start_codon:yes stop_codon:yes gene_type:complete
MPKVPGVTRDLLQKQILELLEGIGIPAKDWIGKGGDKVRRLVTKTDISPFKPNMIQTMSQKKKTFSDALDIFSNEAKFMMNANDQELMNFKNNLTNYTGAGGNPRGSGGEGLASMMKDLETSAKDLKLSTEEAKDLATKQMEEALLTAQYGSPFKVPDKTSLGGNMYAEGNIRTALREFMKTEMDAGRLKPINEFDRQVLTVYGQTTESDPITMFRKYYGEDALDQVADIANVFEKGESFKHYEQLLRENVDPSVLTLKKTGAGEYDLNVKAAEDIRTKVETGEIEPLTSVDEKFKKNMDDAIERANKEEPPGPTIDDDDIPFYAGGRVGLKYGTKKLFNFTKKQLLDAVNDIFPTGDRKYDAEMVSDALVENNPKKFKNKLRDDLVDSERTEIYGIALNALDAFNAEARNLMKPKIDFEDPRIKSALDKAGQKGIALSDAAKIMGYDMSKQKDYFAFEEAIAGGMEGFPKEIKEQVIRAKYGDVVDQRLLDNMLVDDDHFRLAEVFATVEQGLKMQEKGMGGEEIVTAIKADINRKPNATGGGVGSMFKGV